MKQLYTETNIDTDNWSKHDIKMEISNNKDNLNQRQDTENDKEDVKQPYAGSNIDTKNWFEYQDYVSNFDTLHNQINVDTNVKENELLKKIIVFNNKI